MSSDAKPGLPWGAAVAVDAMVLPNKSRSVQNEALPRSNGSPLIVSRQEVDSALRVLEMQRDRKPKGPSPSCPCDSVSFKATRVTSDENQIVTATCSHGACLCAGRKPLLLSPSHFTHPARFTQFFLSNAQGPDLTEKYMTLAAFLYVPNDLRSVPISFLFIDTACQVYVSPPLTHTTPRTGPPRRPAVPIASPPPNLAPRCAPSLSGSCAVHFPSFFLRSPLSLTFSTFLVPRAQAGLPPSLTHPTLACISPPTTTNPPPQPPHQPINHPTNQSFVHTYHSRPRPIHRSAPLQTCLRSPQAARNR